MDKRKLKKIELSVSLLNLIMCYPDNQTKLWIMLRFGDLLAQHYSDKENRIRKDSRRIGQGVATNLLELAKKQADKEIKAVPIDFPIDEMGLTPTQQGRIVNQLNLFNQTRKLKEV